MRVLEVVLVLESVTEESIEAEVHEPHQREREDQLIVTPPPETQEHEWCG